MSAQFDELNREMQVLRSVDAPWPVKHRAFRQVRDLVDVVDPGADLAKLYQPVLMNLLYIRSGLGYDLGQAQRVAAECVRSALRQEAEAYWRVAQLLGRGDSVPRLAPSFHDLGVLPSMEGNVIYTFRFGLMRELAIELFLTGHSVCQIANGSTRDKMKSLYRSIEEKYGRGPNHRLRVIDVDGGNPGVSVFRALRAGSTICVAAEGRPARRIGRHQGDVAVGFLQRRIAIDGGLLRLASAAGARVLAAVAARSNAELGELSVMPPTRLPRDGASGGTVYRSVMRDMYDFFEGHVKRQPDQWEGLSAFHRLVDLSHTGPMMDNDRWKEYVSYIRQGTNLFRTSRDYVVVSGGDGDYCLDVDRMKAIRVERGLEPLAKALVALTAGDSIGATLASFAVGDRERDIVRVARLASCGLCDVEGDGTN